MALVQQSPNPRYPMFENRLWWLDPGTKGNNRPLGLLQEPGSWDEASRDPYQGVLEAMELLLGVVPSASTDVAGAQPAVEALAEEQRTSQRPPQ
jgi:hypothetical protein